MEIKGVLLDFGGTLFDYYPSNAEVWVNIAKRLGFEILPNDPKLLKGLANQLNFLESSAMQKNEELSNINSDNPFDKKIMKWNDFVITALNLEHASLHEIIYEEFKKREGIYKIVKESKELLEELSIRKNKNRNGI